MQPGSLLECIVNGEWASKKNYKMQPGPKAKEIVTHDGNDPDHPGWIKLLEYDIESDLGRLSYPKECFREIQPPMVISIESVISESIKS